ncbi:MAG TPA: hypothetical protein VFO16_09960 [Pseudonocardiaceae bacterium]|nr:hypothetical protein [Pseudonocardiaceae bacterium]
MSALSAAQADAFALLREDICEHLERAESLAFQDNDWSAEDIATARDLIGDLVLGIRGLMIEHESRGDGECRTCASAWPCSVIVTIHGFVKDPEGQFVILARRNRGED